MARYFQKEEFPSDDLHLQNVMRTFLLSLLQDHFRVPFHSGTKSMGTTECQSRDQLGCFSVGWNADALGILNCEQTFLQDSMACKKTIYLIECTWILFTRQQIAAYEAHFIAYISPIIVSRLFYRLRWISFLHCQLSFTWDKIILTNSYLRYLDHFRVMVDRDSILCITYRVLYIKKADNISPTVVIITSYEKKYSLT